MSYLEMNGINMTTETVLLGKKIIVKAFCFSGTTRDNFEGIFFIFSYFIHSAFFLIIHLFTYLCNIF